MGDKTDDMKGRVKEALGDLTDDERLKREGKIDQSAAKIKAKAEDVVDSVREKMTDKLE
jgi:uncharacterized protein YjbJ (UPF0337 family)